MNRLLIVIAVFFVFVACQPALEKAPKIAMEDFFRNPDKNSIQTLTQRRIFFVSGSLGKATECICTKNRRRFGSADYLRNGSRHSWLSLERE